MWSDKKTKKNRFVCGYYLNNTKKYFKIKFDLKRIISSLAACLTKTLRFAYLSVENKNGI